MRVSTERSFMNKHKVRGNNIAFVSAIEWSVAAEPPHPRVQAVDTATEVVFQCLTCSFLRAWHHSRFLERAAHRAFARQQGAMIDVSNTRNESDARDIMKLEPARRTYGAHATPQCASTIEDIQVIGHHR